ncbi:hypothetical protein GCM10027168_73640 [Streptomyces capparidis]
MSRARAATWTGDLVPGLRGAAYDVDLAFAYYAHHLHLGRPAPRGPADDRLDHLDPDAAHAVTEWLDALGLPRATSDGPAAMPLRHAVGIVARRFGLDGRLTRLFVATCFRELAVYLRHPDEPARTAAREEVAGTIAAHRPRVVIAHSLGAVVAYEALHAHPELHVELLLTLGAPLALPHAVLHRLVPAPDADGRGRKPPGVGRWVNVRGRADPLAVPRPLRDHFHGVDADLEEGVGLFDFHRATRYLRCAAVAEAVAPLLAGAPGGTQEPAASP